jgi:2-C-methyl-D-erythritol 2,4-cyclodiphosphate synthase
MKQRPLLRFRTGIGFDFHRFSDSGTVVLGGHRIPGCPALSGHSDADVLIHAVMDAVLGAAGEVDIGTLYPDTDEAYRNADSTELARQVVRMVDERGYSIVNIDAVLVCDRPMISTSRPKIRAELAKAFGVETDQVNIKGKTKEDQPGRGDGIEVMAVALLSGS